MKVPFVKMSGSGNDFVLIDCRDGKNRLERSSFVVAVSNRKTGVGCDGVLFVDDSQKADFTMHYFNSDGGEVEFCGNGARCIAHFAHHRLGLDSGLMFESNAGMISANVEGDSVEVLMPASGEVLGPKHIDIGSERMEYYFVNTGVPHVVILWEDIAEAPVFQLGTALRRHAAFQPAGTNVNFMSKCEGPEAEIEIRTFERGVEDETLACGTGAVACALVALKRGEFALPIRVKVALPDILTIDKRGPRCTLSGLVSEVFGGEFSFRG